MDNPTDKKIVYENRPKLIALLIISWGFIIVCALTGYIFGLIFFGLCAIVTTYPLIDPRKKIIFIGSKKYKEQIEEEWNKKLIDIGIFTYTDNGFIVKIQDKTYDITWDNILAIFGYKVDQYTIDEICIDIFCENNISFRVTEETAGWHVFLDKISKQFPSIKKNWHLEISYPAFATNLTLVFEKDNKTFDESKAYYYNDI